MENKCYCGHTTRCDCGPETLEEVTDRLFDANKMFVNKIFFMRGAEWQKERSYSEKEVFNLLMDFWMEERPEFKTNPVCVSNWFNKIKK